MVSSYALEKIPNFQSTLQHELGHTFGLPHVDVYGYNMNDNPSIMSYNLKHHTHGFNPIPNPGFLIPEDIRALAKNKRVFPQLVFSPAQDIPVGYRMKGFVLLGPMQIPGQPTIKVTTTSSEAFGSKAQNVVHHEIKPSNPGNPQNYDANNMWHSTKTTTGWVSLKIVFPLPVELTGIAIHSQHSGQSHAAKAVRISAAKGGSGFSQVLQTQLRSVDEKVAIPPTRAQIWEIDFQAGSSGMVVIRGLQFYAGNNEIFPPLLTDLK